MAKNFIDETCLNTILSVVILEGSSSADLTPLPNKEVYKPGNRKLTNENVFKSLSSKYTVSICFSV